MLERELKLYIPQAQQAAVQQAVHALINHQTILLAARYFDNPTRCLARQFAALRLRLEGEQWVQTLKMRGEDELSHVEYNHLRPGPVLDLSLYNDTPAEALFTQLASPLEVRYQTDVTRTTAILVSNQTQIELALDLGAIKVKDSTLPISEIEFELKTGSMNELFTLASDWLATFSLRLELRTKSERGDALYEYTLQHPTAIHGAAAALAIAQKPYRLPEPTPVEPTIPALYTKGAGSFISQIIRNATFLAEIDFTQASRELQASYLMLMRVGMRRLRSCRQLFKPWLSPTEITLARAMQKQYKQLGIWRDDDMLNLELQPQLIAAGLPIYPNTSANNQNNTAAQVFVASVEFQLLLLHSLANIVLHLALTPEAHENSAKAQLNKRLQRNLTRIQKRGARFEQLSIKKQHDLRNHIKRLRYNLEVLGYSNSNALYALLAKAQHHLGDLCDAYVAQDWYADQTMPSEQSAFIQDWLTTKINKYQKKSKKTLALLQDQRLPD